MINLIPEEKRNQLLIDLSLNLRGIVAQKLIAQSNHHSYPVFESLFNRDEIRHHLQRKDINGLLELMKTNHASDMQTFNHALLHLYLTEKISYDEAINASDDKNELRLMIKHHQN
jgi:twitching motility protein PilU